MTEDELQLRVGRIGAKGGGRARSFVAMAVVAAQRAGGLHRANAARTGAFGRGRAASLAAASGLQGRARRVVIKARVVRQGAGRGPLGLHVKYLQRDGVSRDEARGAMFDAERDKVDGSAFAERCAEDRHHFRFIVSPEDADRLDDLKAYTRELMQAAERDLGTELDWVAVDHWNTAQPHIHVLVRGRVDGRDLVISKDYISQGLRARAAELATLELGPRSDLEVRRELDAQVGADRWTRLDHGLQRLAVADPEGMIDLRGGRGDALRTIRLARLRKLQALGLADEARPGRWRLSPKAEPTLRALGQGGDIIARMHRAMGEREPDPARFVIDPPAGADRLVGRLAARGLDDELAGTAYAVINGVDGRAHHVPLRDLADAGDAPLGAVVEVGEVAGQAGRRRLALWVRSDLALADQISAEGATWLDRQLVGRDPAALDAAGFGREVSEALQARTEHLVDAALAERRGGRVLFARDLLQTLRERELQAAGARIAAKTGLERLPAAANAVAGTYRQRLNLASGRFAVIEGAMGFTLVPWRPELERHLGRHVEGERLPGGRIAWSFSRTRGLGR